MSYCIVFGCKNRNIKKNQKQLEYEVKKKISFHIFPKDMEKRKKWVEALCLESIQIRKTAAVCSVHFQEEDYEPGYSQRKLKKDAVPYLSQEESKRITENNEESRRIMENYKRSHTIPAVKPAALGPVEEHLISSNAEYKNEVITYVAGYVLRKLMKTLHCTECVNALKGPNTCTNNNLINIKNKGFLLYPSKDLVYICKQVEGALRGYLYTNKNFSNFNTNIFELDVMQKLIHVNIFEALKEHISDQCFSSNHVNHLLHVIIQFYCKIRLSHYIRNVNISDRHKFNKLILFKGQ